MQWCIEYYNAKVEAEILELPDGLLARYLRLTDLMEEFGTNLGMPHTRAIDNGLFELRLKSKEGKRIVMLHFFVKKTQKTPKKELKIAFERLAEILK
jgi:phage-related protein